MAYKSNFSDHAEGELPTSSGVLHSNQVATAVRSGKIAALVQLDRSDKALLVLVFPLSSILGSLWRSQEHHLLRQEDLEGGESMTLKESGQDW